MENNSNRRNYKITDADLCMFTSNLCITLERDIDSLSSFGLNLSKISELKALGDAFEVFQPDIFYQGDVMIATEDKNALRNRVLDTIRSLALRVEIKWGANSTNYRRLEIANLSRLSDDLLLVTSINVHIKMTDYLPNLSDFALTQTMLDEYEDLNTQFKNALNAQADAKVIRENKKVERIAKGNEIYALVNAYCNFGKQTFEKTSPARYNDYIIYSAKSKKAKKKDG